MWLECSPWAFLLLAASIGALRASTPLPANLTLSFSSSTNSSVNANRVSFKDTVQDAVLDTVMHWPDASLVFIQASTTADPTNNPELLTDVRLTFTIENHSPYRTLLLNMSWLWGRWGPAALSRAAPPEHVGVLPLDLGMDIVEADQLIKAHGYMGKYWWVNVALAQIEGILQQVHYVFEMENEGPGSVDVIFVGVTDRSVMATYKGSIGRAVD